MKSTGDPVLDLKALCKEQPRSKADLQTAYRELIWAVPFGLALDACKLLYIEERDGVFHLKSTDEQLRALRELEFETDSRDVERLLKEPSHPVPWDEARKFFGLDDEQESK